MISWSHIVDKIQGVEHDLREIEKIFDSRLYNNDDTQRVVQELGSKNTNEQQQQLRKLCFLNWEALAKDAAGQNLIPDDIFLPRSKIPGKGEFDAIKTSGDGNCLNRYYNIMDVLQYKGVNNVMV